MADERARLPVIGDDDGGQLFLICGRDANDAADSLSLASALLGRPDLAVGEPAEEALWTPRRPAVAGAGAAAAPPGSQHFANSGYVVLRGRDEHAILDVGRHGFLRWACACRCPLAGLVGARTSVPHRPRDGDLHDGSRRPGPVPLNFDAQHGGGRRAVAIRARGPLSLAVALRRAAGALVAGCASEQVVASHDGYAPVVHRRTVVRAAAGLWIVADQLLGEAAHVRMDWTCTSIPAGIRKRYRRTGIVRGGFNRVSCGLVGGTGQVDDFFSDDTGLGWSSPDAAACPPPPSGLEPPAAPR